MFISFLDNFESSSEKLWKMISANVKADVNEMKWNTLIFFCKIYLNLASYNKEIYMIKKIK